MAGSSFGHLFRLTTFGESHGGAVGVVVDGCPPGLPLGVDDIQPELDRRKPGQSPITTPRKEEDTIQILSGVFEGRTTGTPILLLAYNKDQRPSDYEELSKVFRPSHADFTYIAKYGLRDWRGSGRASARETLARVAAGAIAKKYLLLHSGIEILSYVEQVGDIVAPPINEDEINLAAIERSPVRCPHEETAKRMVALVEEVRDSGDSIGGVVRGVIRNVPPGLGEPVFDKLHASLGAALLSINAAKGFDIGSGFRGVSLKGSEHNDPFFVDDDGVTRTLTNHAGGVIGGISSGATISFRVAFKPVSTIAKAQRTVSLTGQEVTLAATGRHDPCVLPRAVPIVDAMSALVLIDHLLRQRAQCGGV